MWENRENELTKNTHGKRLEKKNSDKNLFADGLPLAVAVLV